MQASAKSNSSIRLRFLFYYSVILSIIAIRFSFIFKGSRSFIDESRYSFSLRALESLQRKDISGFFYYLSSTSGRPASAVINLIPASIQGVLYLAFGLNPDTPTSYLVPIFFNCLVLIASMYLFYRIGLLLWYSKEAALVLLIVYSCLINTNVYINHLLPYDLGIFISLFIVFRGLIIVYSGYNVTKLQALQMGSLAMLLLATYPGYYLMIPIAGLILVDWRNVFNRFYEHVTIMLFYLIGIFVIFAFFEIIARLGGASYFRNSSALSETITQGSFEEGFSFLFKYLFQVEGFLGIVLVISIVVSLITIIKFIYDNSFYDFWIKIIDNPIYILATCIVCGFLFHASLSYFFHKVVFYGRLIHPYIIYIIIYGVGSLLTISHKHFSKICLLLSGVSLISFVFFSLVFIKLEYPRDTLYKYGINTDDKRIAYQDEYYVPIELYHYKSPMVLKRGGNYKVYQGRMILVNYAIIDPQQDTTVNIYMPSANSRLLHEGIHFETFPAYAFEGLNINQREFVAKHKFKAKLYIEKSAN